MSHIAEDRIYTLALDNEPAAADETEHLQTCAHCQAQLDDVRALLQDLRLYGAATPSAAARARYYALADEIEPAPSPMRALWQNVVAMLAWDSRQQAAAVRSGALTDYRLLYTSPEGDIELMVAPTGDTRRIEGEFIPSAQTTAPAAMIEWHAAADETIRTVTTRQDGRFRVDALLPGRYQVTVVPESGPLHVIDDLEIS